MGIKVPIGLTYLVQNRPVAAVQLLVGLGEDAPDLEVALLAVERVRGEVHVAPDGHHELWGSLFSLMAKTPTKSPEIVTQLHLHRVPQSSRVPMEHHLGDDVIVLGVESLLLINTAF